MVSLALIRTESRAIWLWATPATSRAMQNAIAFVLSLFIRPPSGILFHMDQASRIVARWADASDVISGERIACGAWKRAVGKKVALRTRALKLVRTTLVVEVEDELWRRNLWSLRYQILRNLE